MDGRRKDEWINNGWIERRMDGWMDKGERNKWGDELKKEMTMDQHFT